MTAKAKGSDYCPVDSALNGVELFMSTLATFRGDFVSILTQNLGQKVAKQLVCFLDITPFLYLTGNRFISLAPSVSGFIPVLGPFVRTLLTSF